MDEPIPLPNAPVDRATHYRSEAARCRADAEATRYPDLKENYLNVAQQWDDLAREVADLDARATAGSAGHEGES